MLNQESDLLKRLKLMDGLKAQLVLDAGQVLAAFVHYRESRMKETLATLAITVYVLAQRLGIDFHALEAVMIEKLQQPKNRDSELEKYFGDYSRLERYLKQKR